MDKIDIRSKISVFIITNGRSTFEFCHKSIQNQDGVEFDIHVVRDKKWVEANNYCLNSCTSDNFLRVDDDMILHPKALLFVYHQIRVKEMKKRHALRFWKLWEPWRNQAVNAIKLYKVKIVKRIGGFRASHLGKVDATFMADLAKSGYGHTADKSMFGVHSCSTFEENLNYAKMRGEGKGRDFKRKASGLKRDIGCYLRDHTVGDPLEFQYKLATGTRLEKLNCRHGRKTRFYEFLKKNDFLQGEKL